MNKKGRVSDHRGIAMKYNIGSVERSARIALGLGFLLAGYAAEFPPWGVAAADSIGLLLFITGAIRYCPLWALLGVSTNGSSKPLKF